MNFSQLITAKLPFSPTADQATVITKLNQFLEDRNDRSAFILKGYAGTGKSTLIAALIKALEVEGTRIILMAPTGRAAKVLAGFSGKSASTIHRNIYRRVLNKSSGVIHYKPAANPSTNTIYVVDEASMISNQSDTGNTKLLDDLAKFVFPEEDTGNKLIFVGDVAQLPPVRELLSRALDALHLRDYLQLKVAEGELTQVTRQLQNSGILSNATLIRDCIRTFDGKPPKLRTSQFNDIFYMGGDKMVDGIQYAYDKYGIEQTILITRSNKKANMYNNQIRAAILDFEEEITPGDLVMIVKNNYFWLGAESPMGFLANGDIARVNRVQDIEDVYGFKFATATIQLIDYPDQPPFTLKIMLDSLQTDGPSISQEELKKLHDAIILEYVEDTPAERNQAIQDNEYLNAIQIKFAYALTCHKAQGGQWKAVFIDQGYIKDDLFEKEYYRWLYTAVTRSSAELFLVNFDSRLLEN